MTTIMLFNDSMLIFTLYRIQKNMYQFNFINFLKKMANLINWFFISILLSASLTGVCYAHPEGHSRTGVGISLLSSFKLGGFDKGAAEIVAYDSKTEQAFVTNAEKGAIDIISLSNPSAPSLVKSISLAKFGSPTSVAFNNKLIAVTLTTANKQGNGTLAIFNSEGTLLNSFKTGALPDMVTFTPNGRYILVANEGEPSDDYTIDPEGSISIIKLTANIKKLDQSSVKTADFKAFNQKDLAPSVRIFGKNASPAQDFEPEYITVSDNSKTAWVSLQENNALAVVSINEAKVTDIIGLGFKSFEDTNAGLDASDKDNKINIQKWPVLGMYQPDSIANYKVKGKTYVVTANEGDARNYSGYSEEIRLAEAELDDSLIKKYPKLAKENNLGRLKITNANGDTNNDGKLDELYTFGARSFSIWDPNTGQQVYDSGSQLGETIAKRYPILFNKDDTRSDDRGVEPEGLAIGEIHHQTYAFIGLERSSGIIAYNISDPEDVYFSDYFTNISSALADDDPMQGDIAPEGLLFINAKDSPIKKPILLAANEVSGTLSVYLVEERQH